MTSEILHEENLYAHYDLPLGETLNRMFRNCILFCGGKSICLQFSTQKVYILEPT